MAIALSGARLTAHQSVVGVFEQVDGLIGPLDISSLFVSQSTGKYQPASAEIDLISATA